MEEAKTTSGLFKPLPIPTTQIVKEDPDLFSKQWINDLSPLFLKLVEWGFFYFLGYFGFGFTSVILFATLHFIKYHNNRKASVTETCLDVISDMTNGDKKTGLDRYPSWVKFPDFDRVNWINQMIRQMWPRLGPFVNDFVQAFIIPEVQRILDSMKLETVSGFRLKNIDLGTIPLTLGGIKVYDEKNLNRDEMVLDAEIAFHGDAFANISLQGVQAKIVDIKVKGLARIILKPILNDFPFIGGFELYFLNPPTLEYGLGGIGTMAEMPGINSIVKTIIIDQIKSRFVWPNKYHLYFPLESVLSNPNRSYCLPKPYGLLEVYILEGRKLMKMDKNLIGHSTSDPYVIVKIGETTKSFREAYQAKTVNPVWNYSVKFALEDEELQQRVLVQVFDYDSSTTDDFMGEKSIDLSSSVGSEEWVTLDKVPHGDIKLHLNCRKVFEKNGFDQPTSTKDRIVSLYVDSCKNVAEVKGTNIPYPKVVVKYNKEEIYCTKSIHKTKNPKYEEGCLLVTNADECDHILFQVSNSRNGQNALGWARLDLSYLDLYPGREFYDMEFKLNDSSEGIIYLSAKMYAVH